MSRRISLYYRKNGTDCVCRGEAPEDFSYTISDDGERRTVTIRANVPMELRGYRESALEFYSEGDVKEDLYFLNGYQSWTDSREWSASEKEWNVKRLPSTGVRYYALDRYGDATFYPYRPTKLHGYDIFYRRGAHGAFLCSLNRGNAYLITEISRRDGRLSLASDLRGASLQPGETYRVCDYIYKDSYEGGLALLQRYFPKRPIRKLLGYTSWYNYYQNVSEEILLRDLAALDERFELFQIDDGYESFVGDWLEVDAKKFPHGLAPIAQKAHEKGMLAGIWLAPFVAERKSRLYREHRDWFRPGENGKPVRCGSNWSGFFALDLEKPEVRDYIRGCLRHYADMGFDFFKLDFLYACSLPTYPGKTRSRVAAEAYDFLRETLSDRLILACGATGSDAAGVFDYARVGPDVSLKFDDAWYMRFTHRERISTKVTLQNTIYRSFLNGRFFGNDPDVFLLRDENSSLSAQQKRALVTLNALYGSLMMTSDNIADYDADKHALLDAALELFSHAEAAGHERRGDSIIITYTHNGREHRLHYDTKRGVLRDG